MGLEQVIEEVRRDGDKRSQSLLDEARREADEILREAQERVDAYKAAQSAQLEKEIAQLKVQVASSAEFSSRKAVLNEEAALREQLRKRILEGFAAFPESRRKKHITALLKKAGEVIPEGRVWAAEQDLGLLGRKYEVAGATDILGGVIVESEDASMRLDLSYETLVDDLWRDILKSEAGLFA